MLSSAREGSTGLLFSAHLSLCVLLHLEQSHRISSATRNSRDCAVPQSLPSGSRHNVKVMMKRIPTCHLYKRSPTGVAVAIVNSGTHFGNRVLLRRENRH
jgi:hypothetical protein